jgi:tetratricopeptide (TPR) repeat protein
MRLFLWVLSFAFYCHAADFSKADELYAKRENNLDAIHEAMAIYRDILNQSQEPELRMRAMTFLGRLAFYEGELLTPTDDTGRRMEIFAALQTDAEQVGSAFWRALALGLWCRSAGVAAAWWYLGDLKEALNRALIEEPNVEEGGIYRILAGLYSASSALSIYDLYNLDLALQYANQAATIAPHRLEVHLLKSYVLHKLGRTEEAADLMRKSIAEFSNKTDLSPENKIYLQRVQQKLAGHCLADNHTLC